MRQQVVTDDALEALTDLTPRLTRLLRSVSDPGAPAVGAWSVGDVAAHLSHVATVDLALARGEGEGALDAMDLPVPRDVSGVASLNATALARDPLRDPQVMASRIEASVALLVELCRDAERVVPWLLGAQLPRAAVCWHYVSELALHGRDIANGARLRWEIDPYHARMAIEGFYVPMIGALDAASAGDDDPDWPSCEVRLRGGGRFSFAGTGSGVTLRPPDHRVDLHISADPVAMLLVMSGRSGRLLPALRGRMVAWGKHPVRAMRLLARMEAP